MRMLMESPPPSLAEPVTEVLHGVPVTDPYRWLEDQESPETRAWLAAQTTYARSYLDAIPGRGRIRERVRELLEVETYDSIQKAGRRYFFRKRLPTQEQPCIFVREGADGEDQMLIDPSERGNGKYVAVRPIRVSPDGRLLLYEVKEGGERTGSFELLDIETRKVLPDVLSRGYLRGFAFAPDCRSFYYVHEPVDPRRPQCQTAYQHVLGTSFKDDQARFAAGEDEKTRLHIVSGEQQLGFLVLHFLDKPYTDFYFWPFGSGEVPQALITGAEYKFGPVLLKDGRILAITDRDASNFRIVEVRPRKGFDAEFIDVIPAGDAPIQDWIVAGGKIFVSFIRKLKTEVLVFDLSGKQLGEVPVDEWGTVRLVAGSDDRGELFFEHESFTKPIQICRYSPTSGEVSVWAERRTPFEGKRVDHFRVWFTANDGTRIPMFLVGHREVFESGSHPTVMTSYGGYGMSMTPQFSVFVAFLIERGCLFALPNIRGGSEFGVEWHRAAKRQNRQVAFDDFLAAAEWLIATGRTEPQKLAIFGGSNSGLLMGAAMTQRPDLFRAVICMVPMLDMLRYHLFDNARLWTEEFGTVDAPDDFAALLSYSPYQKVRESTAYPATMFVSGDADQTCNALHARKMTARLQAANVSERPILLNYNRARGHSPVLPFSVRIESLTDRMAFLCDQLQLPV